MVIWLRRLAWGVGALALLWLILWLGLAALLKWQLPLRAGEALGRRVTVGDLSFHPWSLDLALDGLAIAGPSAGAEPLLKVARLHANLSAASLFRFAPVIEALEVDGLPVRVARTGEDDPLHVRRAATPRPIHFPEKSMTSTTDTITLGGGCFWCLEAVYERVRGVVAVESGYANGRVVNPSYEQVCSGTTGHAEVVRVRFDPAQITLREVLEIFFVIHDPTTLNRQGNDIGTQYRSGIYVQNAAQEAVARAVLAEVDALHQGGVVTELLPEQNYWRAEDYHQHYFANHPNQGYCAMVVAPKVEKFRKTFAARVLPA